MKAEYYIERLGNHGIHEYLNVDCQSWTGHKIYSGRWSAEVALSLSRAINHGISGKGLSSIGYRREIHDDLSDER